MGVVRGSGSPDLLPPGVTSITREGYAITVLDRIDYQPRPKRRVACRYCKTRLEPDGRQRCNECGAPARFENGIPS